MGLIVSTDRQKMLLVLHLSRNFLGYKDQDFLSTFLLLSSVLWLMPVCRKEIVMMMMMMTMIRNVEEAEDDQDQD